MERRSFARRLKGLASMLKPKSSFRGKAAKLSAIAVTVVGLGIGSYFGYLQLSGNFHTVIAGELYRSGQPTAAQLEAYARDYGIKTIVNLRGKNTKSKWYADEIATAERLGLQHIDFRMSASKELTPETADQLVTILKAAPKPILVHCQAGSDRSGLVSVIYSHEIAGIEEEVAERQLSIRFGHVAIPYFSSAFAMDKSWEDLEAFHAGKNAAGFAVTHLERGSGDTLQ